MYSAGAEKIAIGSALNAYVRDAENDYQLTPIGKKHSSEKLYAAGTPTTYRTVAGVAKDTKLYKAGTDVTKCGATKYTMTKTNLTDSAGHTLYTMKVGTVYMSLGTTDFYTSNGSVTPISGSAYVVGESSVTLQGSQVDAVRFNGDLYEAGTAVNVTAYT